MSVVTLFGATSLALSQEKALAYADGKLEGMTLVVTDGVSNLPILVMGKCPIVFDDTSVGIARNAAFIRPKMVQTIVVRPTLTKRGPTA